MNEDPYARAALLVVDVQQAFDEPTLVPRNNPACDDNIDALVRAWSAASRPLVYVQHHSTEAGSPLRPDSPGSALKPYLTAEPDLLVTKSVNSSFHGTPDLDAWLHDNDVTALVVCGITTNHCCRATRAVRVRDGDLETADQREGDVGDLGGFGTSQINLSTGLGRQDRPRSQVQQCLLEALDDLTGQAGTLHREASAACGLSRRSCRVTSSLAATTSCSWAATGASCAASKRRIVRSSTAGFRTFDSLLSSRSARLPRTVSIDAGDQR
ncbi:MAG: isochorismatase family protein [Nocardioidaceae bacterium]